jgi:hypothetical protein
MQKFASYFFVCCALIYPAYAHPPSSLPSEIHERQAKALERALSAPYPTLECPPSADPGQACIWGRLNFGLASLFSTNPHALVSGNARIGEALTLLSHLPDKMAAPGYPNSSKHFTPSDRIAFHTASIIQRIYFLSVRKGAPPEGRLTKENIHAIESLLWQYARQECTLADARKNTWSLAATENISLMRETACWGAAKIFSARTGCGACIYNDHSTPGEQLASWTSFLSEYLRQRARFGGLIEYFSPVYYKYTLQAIYNIADFSSDKDLRRLATNFLHLWWGQWAQEQVGGIHGGSKARANPTSIASQEVGTMLAWYYFGIGRELQPGLMVSMIASEYTPPDLVREIARGVGRPGKYVVRSRAPGLLGSTRDGRSELDFREGGILRYAYVTPEFIMSLATVPKLPREHWIAISEQNRWSGVTAQHNGVPSYVFARPLFLTARTRSYNDTWGVQSKATQIVQKISSNWSRNAGPMAIWLSDNVILEKEGLWYFARAGDAYVAFRAAFGDLKPKGRTHLVLTDERSPVLLQAAPTGDFSSFSKFKEAIASLPLVVGSDEIRMRGLGEAGTLTFYFDGDRLPEVDGTPIDLAPHAANSSPFIQSDWGGALVTLRANGRELILDFN